MGQWRGLHAVRHGRRFPRPIVQRCRPRHGAHRRPCYRRWKNRAGTRSASDRRSACRQHRIAGQSPHLDRHGGGQRIAIRLGRRFRAGGRVRRTISFGDRPIRFVCGTGAARARVRTDRRRTGRSRRAALAGNRPPCRRHGWAGSYFRIRSVPGSVRSAYLHAVELRAPAAYRGGVVVESDGADARQLRQNQPFPRILGRLRVGGGKRLAQPSAARRVGAQSQSSHQSRPIQLAIRHELRLHMEHRRA